MKKYLLILVILSLCFACEKQGGKKVTGGSTEDVVQDKNSGQIEKNLKDFLKGKFPAKDLKITYSDLHPIHGGTKISFTGTGEVKRETRRKPEKDVHNVSAEDVKTLVKKLIELKCWEQRKSETGDPPNVRRTDQSKGFLTIKTGAIKLRIWEYHQSRVRTLSVFILMKSLATK
ncbi:MAG: hypothetical protein P1V97_38420 [Planctomycetota bacterium]|nr:hypothetical protein [Planctomycetota bacterium]